MKMKGVHHLFILLTLANTKKLNAISPNPTAVNVNESTSPIKFTLTSLSLLSRFAICSGGSGNSVDDLFRGETSALFIPSEQTFLPALGRTNALPWIDRQHSKTKSLMALAWGVSFSGDSVSRAGVGVLLGSVVGLTFGGKKCYVLLHALHGSVASNLPRRIHPAEPNDRFLTTSPCPDKNNIV
jgi:hypothetical protein